MRSLLGGVAPTAACTMQGVRLLAQRLDAARREMQALAAHDGSGGSLTLDLAVEHLGPLLLPPASRVAPSSASLADSAISGATSSTVGSDGSGGGNSLCIWLTADTNQSRSVLRGPLSSFGHVRVHDDAQAGHTAEDAPNNRVDVSTVLGIPATNFSRELHLDAVDFYLLGEMDHTVKGDVSSFGEYGFLRGGLPPGSMFLRYNNPGGPAPCFSASSTDLAFVRRESVVSPWGVELVEEGLAVPTGGAQTGVPLHARTFELHGAVAKS